MENLPAVSCGAEVEGLGKADSSEEGVWPEGGMDGADIVEKK